MCSSRIRLSCLSDRLSRKSDEVGRFSLKILSSLQHSILNNMHCIFSCVHHLYSYPKQVSHFWKIGLVIICCGFILVLTPNNWAELLRKLVRSCSTWNFSAGLMETPPFLFFGQLNPQSKLDWHFGNLRTYENSHLWCFSTCRWGKKSKYPASEGGQSRPDLRTGFYLLFLHLNVISSFILDLSPNITICFTLSQVTSAQDLGVLQGECDRQRDDGRT